MKMDSRNPTAPDRLSTSEEIRRATLTSPEPALGLHTENKLLDAVWMAENDIADLTSEELGFLFQLGTPGDEPLN